MRFASLYDLSPISHHPSHTPHKRQERLIPDVVTSISAKSDETTKHSPAALYGGPSNPVMGHLQSIEGRLHDAGDAILKLLLGGICFDGEVRVAERGGVMKVTTGIDHYSLTAGARTVVGRK
jgi:hypothetical protein